MPHALLLRTAGTNCDAELARAFTLAGASASTLHIDALIKDPAPIASADIIAIPGGFSYGDDIASGRLLALRLKHNLWIHLANAYKRGALFLGVCNGFQVLVQLGLLPALDPISQSNPPTQTTSLTHNDSHRFTDRWVRVQPEPTSPCIWTRDLPNSFQLPIAHAEGRFTAQPDTLDRIEANNLVPLRYAEPVNGSANNIAALTDPTGRVLGLMPHPERSLTHLHHPAFNPANSTAHDTPGLAIFKNAVNAAAQHATVEPI